MSWFSNKFKGIREYFGSQETQQSLTVFVSFTSDAFKVVMASLLCIFVPQQCDSFEDNRSIFDATFGSKHSELSSQINGTTNVMHVCTFSENFTNLIDFNTFVLAFNFFTLGYFIYLYYVELIRERWMINNLDYDKEKPDDNILFLKTTHPSIIEQLQIYNKQYMKAYKYIYIIYIINFVSSAVLVIYFYYYDYRTITALLTNTALCSNKLRIGRNLAIQSYKKEFAYSFYNVKNISFNEVDRRLLIDEENLFNQTNLDKKEDNIHKQRINIKKYISTL